MCHRQLVALGRDVYTSQSDYWSVGKVRKYFPLYIWYLLCKCLERFPPSRLKLRTFFFFLHKIRLKVLKSYYKYQTFTCWAIGTRICNSLQLFGTYVNFEWILQKGRDLNYWMWFFRSTYYRYKEDKLLKRLQYRNTRIAEIVRSTCCHDSYVVSQQMDTDTKRIFMYYINIHLHDVFL